MIVDAGTNHGVFGFGLDLIIDATTIHAPSSIAKPNNGNQVCRFGFNFSFFGAIFVSPDIPLKSLKENLNSFPFL